MNDASIIEEVLSILSKTANDKESRALLQKIQANSDCIIEANSETGLRSNDNCFFSRLFCELFSAYIKGNNDKYEKKAKLPKVFNAWLRRINKCGVIVGRDDYLYEPNENPLKELGNLLQYHGMTDLDIADKMYICDRTVRKYRQEYNDKYRGWSEILTATYTDRGTREVVYYIDNSVHSFTINLNMEQLCVLFRAFRIADAYGETVDVEDVSQQSLPQEAVKEISKMFYQQLSGDYAKNRLEEVVSEYDKGFKGYIEKLNSVCDKSEESLEIEFIKAEKSDCRYIVKFVNGSVGCGYIFNQGEGMHCLVKRTSDDSKFTHKGPHLPDNIKEQERRIFKTSDVLSIIPVRKNN